MLKLREPFSKKVHLHIRQDMLQRLWDKYVPTSSPEYEQIQLIYLDGETGERGQRPEQVQLLLNLIIRNQRMQMRLEQSPALAKFAQKQMEGGLKRMERHYMTQLKSCDFAVYRNVKQYFALLWQAEKGDLRYRSWQKACQAIEKQREEYRLLSLFSVRLREYSAEYSVRAMRTVEKELLRVLSETEYRTLAEDIIWQEKQEFLAYLRECDETQCRRMVQQLEKEKSIRQVFYAVRKQSAQEKLVEAVTKMEQKEFCFVYHQAAQGTDIIRQKEIWKKSRTEMLRFLEQAKPAVLQKVWVQLEKSAGQTEKFAEPTEKSAVQVERFAEPTEKSARQTEKFAEPTEKSAVQAEKSAGQIKNLKQMAVKEKTVFQRTQKSARHIKKVLAERMEHLREQYRKEEIKNLQERAAVMLEKNTFQKIADIVDIGQLVREFNVTESEGWLEHSAAEPEEWLEHSAAEPEGWLEHSAAEPEGWLEHSAAEPEEPPVYAVMEHADQRNRGIMEHTDRFSGDGVSYVFYRLDQEREIRRERIEHHQAQAFETYREFYQQVLPEDWQDQEQADQQAERTFLSRHRQEVTKEEVWNIRKWSRMLLESFLIKQKQDWRDAEISEKELYTEQKERENQTEAAKLESRTRTEETALSADRKYKLELIHMIKQINRYMEEQNISDEKVTLNWRENLPKDPEIQRLLVHIQELKETQRTEFIKYLADMILILQQENLSHNVKERETANIMLQYEKTESSKSVPQMTEKEFSEKISEIEDRTFAEKILKIEDRAFAEKILKVEDRTFAEQLLKVENRAFAEKILKIEDREFAEQILKIEDRIFAEQLLKVENRAFAEKILKIEDRTFAEQILKIEDREFAEQLLEIDNGKFAEQLMQLEDREFAESLLRTENKRLAENLLKPQNRAFVQRLFQKENKDIIKKLFQIEEKRFVEESLPGNERIPGISHWKLWEWGEALLSHPEYEQERQDADILSGRQQEVVFSEEAGQENLQTQVIRRQIELAKDRNHLQKLLRQINHRIDAGLVYTDVQLSMPQVQELLHDVRQLDEAQYGILVKELSEVVKMQKLLDAGQEPAVTASDGLSNISDVRELYMAETEPSAAHREQDRQEIQQDSVQSHSAPSRNKKQDKREMQQDSVQSHSAPSRNKKQDKREMQQDSVQSHFVPSRNKKQDKREMQRDPAEFAQKDMKEKKQSSGAAAQSLEHRKGKGYQAASYTVLAKRIQQFETQRRLAVRRKLRKMEENLGLPVSREENARNLMKEEAYRGSAGIEAYENYNKDSAGIEAYENYNRDSAGIEAYENYNRDSAGIEAYESYNRDSASENAYERYNEGYPYILEGNNMAGYFPAPEENNMTGSFQADRNNVTGYPYAPEENSVTEYFQAAEEGNKTGNFQADRNNVTGYPYAPEENSVTEYFQAAEEGNMTGNFQADRNSVTGYPYAPGENSVTEYFQAAEENNTGGYLRTAEENNTGGYLQAEENNVIEYLQADGNGVTEYPQTASMENDSLELSKTRLALAPHRNFADRQNVRPPSYRLQELEYSIQKTGALEEEQQRARIRMEEENAQIRSAQEQLDKKLKEVEQQLKKTEGAAQAREDVRSFAEQVKRQLYEELHVEKLRRGLV